MTNWKLLTGCFAGSVVSEACPILDVDFANLDKDLQTRIREWAKDNNDYIEVDGGANFARRGGVGSSLNMNDIKEDYEQSWDSEETDENIDLVPVSEW